MANHATPGSKLFSYKIALIALRSEQEEKARRNAAFRDGRLEDEAQAAERSIIRFAKESSRAKREANDSLQSMTLTFAESINYSVISTNSEV